MNSELYSNIILHVPHASQNLPDFFFKDKKGKNLMIKESSPLIDLYTDELFLPDEGYDNRFITIVPDYCRTLCDVERLKNDPLEKRGLGILYGPGNNPSVARRCFSLRDGVDEIMLAYYDDYHAKAAETIRSCRFPLIVDCHSFSSRSTKLITLTPEQAEIDICLGFNDDKSCPPSELLDLVREHFEARGYKVALNNPFSNSKTFDTGDHPCHSMMIEINKRLYMDEDTCEKKIDSFYKLKRELFGLSETLPTVGLVKHN